MTEREYLRKRARILLVLMIASCLPGACAYGVTMLFATPHESNAFVAWCADSWWWLILLGIASYLFMSTLATWFVLRCPSCRFRFTLASITTFAIARLSSLIRFCPHCGVELSAMPAADTLPPRG